MMTAVHNPSLFTSDQLATISLVERVASSFSLLGALFIIITFVSSQRFRHKPINRLVFAAAFGNIWSNVGTMIGPAGIAAGDRSSLCGFQALLIQVFLPADVLLCSCMALNVYLTVCRKFSAEQIRRLEKYYIIVCYGIPMTVGVIFEFIKPARGPIYGNAILWCWIGNEWEFLRLAAFYGPVWIIILFTIAIYIRCGIVIWGFRHTLRMFGKAHPSFNSRTDPASSRIGGSKHADAIQLTTVTQVEITEMDMYLKKSNGLSAPATGYSCAVSVGDSETEVDVEKATASHNNENPFEEPEQPITPGSEIDIFDRNSRSSIVASRDRIQVPQSPSVAKRAMARSKNTMKANAAAWAYARCAAFFFFALIITWLPASMNRVYAYVHPHNPHYALYIASGIVLPSQGFWNAIIYTITTWSTCKEIWYELVSRIKKNNSAPQIVTSDYIPRDFEGRSDSVWTKKTSVSK